MNLLAFDTATELLAVAVHTPACSRARVVPGGAAASAALLPLAHALLAEAGLAMNEVQFIAYGRGPGAFTGLRTSCAVAQGLALGLGCPVLAIDSLLIVAEDARLHPGAHLGGSDLPLDVGVAMDARMGEIYAARWCWQPATATWQALEAARVTSPQALAQAWAGANGPAVVAGSALTAYLDNLPWPAATRRLPVEHDRAAALLRLALAAQAADQGVDAAQALPLYVRDKVAQTTAERAALKAAQVEAPPPTLTVVALAPPVQPRP
jgi:tRNA threonylcarbamoyladenosine biosynthesis protein TsaB